MPDKNPFSPSSGLAFLTGLTSSMMGTFKENSARERAEEDKAKDTDFKLLMAALEQLKPDLTPSQAQDILTRAVDIYKPKGHGGIKEQLGQLFGRGGGYEPQAGKILGSMSKPKVDVGTVAGSSAPSTFEGGNVTLPPPPEMPYNTSEKTYRQLDQEDVSNKYGAQLDKQLAYEDARQENRLELQKQRNADILSRFKEEQGIKDDSVAMRQLRGRASLFGDPDDPSNQERARTSLMEELQTKKQVAQARIDYQHKRLQQIDSTIKLAEQRVEIARRSAGSKAANWNNDPQVKGAWAKVSQYKEQAKTLRTQAVVRYSQGDLEGAALLEQEAEKAENTMQGVIDKIEQRVGYLNSGGGVKLPNPPAKGSTQRGGAKLTEAEIRAAGGSDKDVEEARRKGVLAP